MLGLVLRRSTINIEGSTFLRAARFRVMPLNRTDETLHDGQPRIDPVQYRGETQRPPALVGRPRVPAWHRMNIAVKCDGELFDVFAGQILRRAPRAGVSPQNTLVYVTEVDRLNPDGEKLEQVLRLNSASNLRNRFRWLRMLAALSASDQKIYQELMGFPEDLPDLRAKLEYSSCFLYGYEETLLRTGRVANEVMGSLATAQDGPPIIWKSFTLYATPISNLAVMPVAENLFPGSH
jgi:hypothetical protein